MHDTNLPVRLLQFSFSVGIKANSGNQTKDFLNTDITTSEMTFISVTKGNLQVSTHDKVHSLSSGDRLFLNSRQTYKVSNLSQESFEVDLLLFHPDFLFGEFDTVLTGKYLNPFMKAPPCGSFLLPKSNETYDFGSLCDSIKVLIEDQSFAYELTCKELLCKLFRMLLTYSRELTDAHQSKAASVPSSYDITRMKEAMAFFQENYMNPIALEEIADAIHLSSSECCRCFRRTVNATPIEYLNKYRILESIKRIKAGDAIADNISNLAYSVGFNSPSYYNLIFRRYFDCTPSKYKRKFAPVTLPL
jgi:AraC-like DNA-binding protein